MITRLTLFLYFVLIVNTLTGQKANFIPNYTNFTIEFGLPSNEVYDCLQDTSGILWITTDRGIVQYNGYEFNLFTTKDGLADNVNFNIIADHEGKPWFVGFNNKLSYFENGKLHPYPHNSKIEKLIDSLNYLRYPIQYLFDNNNTLHLSLYGQGHYSITNEGKVNYESSSYPNCDYINQYESIDGEMFYTGIGNCSTSVNTTSLRFNTSDSLITKQLQLKTIPGQSFFNTLPTREILIYNPKYKFQVDTNHRLTIKKLYGKNIHEYIVDYITDSNPELIEFLLHHPTLKISNIERDNSNGLWLCTLNKGIFYFPYTQTKTFQSSSNKEDKSAYSVEIVGKKILFNSIYGEFTLLDSNKIIKNTTLIGHDQNIKSSGIYINNNHYIACKDSRCLVTNLTNNTYKILNLKDFSVNSLLTYNDTTYLFSTGDYLKFYADRNGKITHQKFRLSSSQKSFSSILYNRRILLGTKEGLFYIDKNSFKKVDFFTRKERVNALLSKDSLLFIGSLGNGLYIYDLNQLHTISKEDNLVSNNINAFAVDSYANLWVATNNGISIVKTTPPYTVVKNINRFNGLSSNEVFDLTFKDGFVYAGTRNGLNKIDIKKLLFSDKHNVNLHLSEVKVNERKRPVSSTLTLSHQENNLEFQFVSIQFSNVDNIQYKYRVFEIDSNWTLSKQRTVRFPNLPYGNYTFQVAALNDKGKWSSPIQKKFTIHPAFWQTKLFQITFIIIIMVILSMIFFIRYRNLLVRKELESKVEKYRYKALTSQMNPHFIFNALNSIQFYILDQNRRSASKYLSTFAKLIRASFENSKEELIPLADEINALKLYVELENLRLNNTVEVDYSIDENLDLLSTKIPPLLIQPFVENAFLHGLSPQKEKKKTLKISIYNLEKQIKIIIDDTGIGRKASLVLKQKKSLRKHNSSGINISEARIKAIAQLDKYYKIGYQFEVVDKVDAQQNSEGTKVIILIPKMNPNSP